MQHVGYSLVDATGTEVQSWGGLQAGVTAGAPQMIRLPNGNDVHCPALGQLGDWQLLERWLVDDKPQGQDLIRHDVAVESGKVVVRAIYAARDLATYKTESKAKISSDAEACREKYLTPGSLKAMSYLKVAQEAATYVATQGAGNYPLLQARVTSGRYPDLATAAAGTITIEDATTSAAAAIDAIEDHAKLLIDAATSIDEVNTALQVTWP